MPSISRVGCRWAAALVAIASVHTAALAAPVPPDSAAVVSGPLTLKRALALTRRFESGLRAAGLRADAARARISDTRRRPNPTLSVSEENFGGNLSGRRRESTLAIGQELELGGNRGARTAASEAEYRLATADVSALQREALSEASERYIAAWALQARNARLAEGERLARLAIASATERFQAGASPRLEILRAQSRANSQAMERRRAESQLAVARNELALSWGATTANFDSLAGPETIAPGDTSGLQSRLSAHPDLVRATADEALATARVRLATAARIPALTVSGGVRRLEEVPGTGFLLGLEVPIPVWSRGAGGIAAAQRELEAATSTRRAAEQRLRVELSSAIERLTAAAQVYDTLSVRIRPEQAQIVDELLRGYRSGRSSYLDLVAEQNNLLETELALIDARADLWRAQLRLEVLTATGLLTPREAR